MLLSFAIYSYMYPETEFISDLHINPRYVAYVSKSPGCVYAVIATSDGVRWSVWDRDDTAVKRINEAKGQNNE